MPRIKEIVTDVFEATGRSIYRPGEKAEGPSRSHSSANYNAFELMGFDFMLDSELNLYLIEVNTNPCLDTPCMLLQRMIPQVLDQTLKLAVDPFLQASEHQYYMTQDLNVSEMRFQLVYQDSMEMARADQKGISVSDLRQRERESETVVSQATISLSPTATPTAARVKPRVASPP